MAYRRKEKRTSRLSVVISAVFHAIIIGVLAVLAAREGILGKQLKKIAVTMVPRQKPEKPKEKEPEPKPLEPKPKVEESKSVEPPSQVARPEVAPPSVAATVAPAAAPPAATLPAFDFEGGKAVETTSDPNALYKSFVEYTLRSRWHRPEDVRDEHYVAEVEIAVDRNGRVLNTIWEKGSGDAAWDNSVRKVFAEITHIGRAPPKGFPDRVLVRFDVQEPTEISLE